MLSATNLAAARYFALPSVMVNGAETGGSATYLTFSSESFQRCRMAAIDKAVEALGVPMVTVTLAARRQNGEFLIARH